MKTMLARLGLYSNARSMKVSSASISVTKLTSLPAGVTSPPMEEDDRNSVIAMDAMCVFSTCGEADACLAFMMTLMECTWGMSLMVALMRRSWSLYRRKRNPCPSQTRRQSARLAWEAWL